MRRWLLFCSFLCARAQVSVRTVFAVQFDVSADPNAATPQEYFTALQEAFADAATGTGADSGDGSAGGGTGGTGGTGSLGSQIAAPHFQQGSFLAQVAFTENSLTEAVTMKVCDMEPFWEKGQTVYDLRECRLSPVKLIVWSLIPAVTLSCGSLGFWSWQRNVRGRGKETQIGTLVGIGVSFLSVGYDWFFSWTLCRNPVGDFQQRVYEVGLVVLAAGIVINFLVVHFWFRRKFLVSMPWYEYHKHGLGLHVIFLLMYANPQACFLFTCRLFDVDLFNIHFGTPSKMNEVLSRIGCLSLLSDTPLLVLKALVYFMDTTGIQAPKVTRVSMGVTVIHLALVLKRQYVSSVERQWYQEIVRMAGVRRLTTYGGASRWLKFQKRPSAAADLQGAGNSQQQLFLAWMQSMGRRQESIFQDAASKPAPARASQDAEELSDDSEDDAESLSEDSEASEEGEERADARPAATRASRRSEHVPKAKDGSESESDDAEGKPQVELQSQRAGVRPGREERALHRRGLGSQEPKILGYARQVADEVGQSDGVSVSDIMMFAKRIAANPSESGVVTESFGVDAFSNDMFSDNSLGGSALLRFARGVAQRGDLSSAAGTSAAESDVLAFARKVAQRASESGVGTGISDGTDIIAFARKAARAVSQSGISQGASESDVLAFARKAAREISQSGVGASETDILAFARKAAEDVSQSGAVSENSVLAFARRVAHGQHSEVSATSAATSQTDFLAFARRAAQDVSKSGVASSAASGAESDMYAFAQQVAGDVSQSGIRGTSEAASSVRASDIFAVARRATLQVPEPPAKPASSIASESDIMQFAQKVARDVSDAGFSRPSEVSDSQLLESRSGAGSDVLAFARRAAQAVGSSTVPSEDLLVPARRVLPEGNSSVVSGSELDLFGVARTAADQVSRSGVGSASVAGSGVADIFAHVESSRSGADSDIFAVAKKTAAQVSDAGISVPGSLAGGIGELFTHAESASGVSDDDLFAAARGAADQVSRSGVQSAMSIGLSAGGMRDLFAPVRVVPPEDSEAGSDLMAAAQRAADAVSSGVASSVVSAPPGGRLGDLFVPKAAGQVRDPVAPPKPSEGSESGSDLFGLARGVAAEASRSGVHSAASSVNAGRMRDLFAPPLRVKAARAPVPVAPPPEDSEAGSDLMAAAQRAADAVSSVAVSSVASATPGGRLGDLFVPSKASSQAKQPVAPPKPSEGSESGSDLFGLARGVAAEASRSGVHSAASSINAGGRMRNLFAPPARGKPARSPVPVPPHEGSESDLLAFAKGTAAEVSRSGVQSAMSAGPSAGMRDLFAPARAARKAVPPPPPRPEDSEAGSDLMAAAQRAADAVSSVAASSVASATSKLSVPKSRHVKTVPPPPPRPEDSEAGSDLMAAAQRAADAVSSVAASSVASATQAGRLGDLFVPKGSESDLLAFAKGTAAEASQSGVQSSVRSAAPKAVTDLFTPHRTGSARSVKEDRDYKRKASRVATEATNRPPGTTADASRSSPSPRNG